MRYAELPVCVCACRRQEASYEPAPQTLPADAASKRDLVLLTIHLSSTGEVVIHRSSSAKSVDTGTSSTAAAAPRASTQVRHPPQQQR